jgi:predicted TIM-barrel fold metal-dependent hydrolase
VRAPGLPQLETLLQRFPTVRIILDHMARPVVDDGPPYASASSLFALSAYDNLFLKLTTHNLRDSRQGAATPQSFLPKVIEAFGAMRVAWGSNYPAAEGTLGELLADARAALEGLPAEARNWIFSRTAKSLYAQ